MVQGFLSVGLDVYRSPPRFLFELSFFYHIFLFVLQLSVCLSLSLSVCLSHIVYYVTDIDKQITAVIALVCVCVCGGGARGGGGGGGGLPWIISIIIISLCLRGSQIIGSIVSTVCALSLHCHFQSHAIDIAVVVCVYYQLLVCLCYPL